MKHVLFAAQLCDAVYSMSAPEGLGIVASEEVRHQPTCTQGMVYVTADAIWFVFAGTNERRDWLSNFKIIKKNAFGWFPAHKGFAECAEAVIGPCRSILQRWPGRKVWVSGHSLGGSIAGLVAIGLQQLARTLDCGNVGLITLGQPRFSTGALIRAALPGEYIRVVNGSDVVPRVPKLGYSHAGTELYLKNIKGYCIDPGSLEKFLDRLPTASERVRDHRTSDYLRDLQRLL